MTAGATEAIAAALLALIEPGDEVIAFEPYYDSYAACIALAGGIRVPVTLRPPGLPARPGRAARRGHPADPADPAELAAQPDRVGVHPRRADRDRGAGLRAGPAGDQRRGLRAHGVRRASTCRSSRCRACADRTVSISSAGKTFSFTGWKVGWVTASAELVAAVRAVKQFLTFVSGGPFQYAVAEALQMPDAYFTGISEDLRGQRDLLCGGLAAGRVQVYPPDGTYFVTTDISPFGDADGWSSAGTCRTGPASSRSPARCSTTIPRPGGCRSGSRSASGPRCCRRHSPGSPDHRRAADPRQLSTSGWRG